MKPLTYHSKVPIELRDTLDYYGSNSQVVADKFWEELKQSLESIRKNPKMHHFDASGLRRCNMKNFPYHILYYIGLAGVRIIALKHYQQKPGYGTRRL